MLNKGKGPAVHSLRAQADKQDYTREMRKTLENTDNLTIRQGEVSELIVESGEIRGIKIGEERNSERVAMDMLMDNYPLPAVVKISKLSEAVVLGLAEKLGKPIA